MKLLACQIEVPEVTTEAARAALETRLHRSKP